MRRDVLRFLLAAFVGLVVSGVGASDAFAQSCPAGRTCFYVPPAAATPPGYTVGWDLVLTSSSGTVTGTYKIGTAAAVAFSVTPTTPQLVTLSTTQGVVSAYRTAEQRGIFVQADSEALGVTRRLIVGPWQASASIKDAARSLGQRFRLGGYSLNATNTTDTGFDMVSVYAPSGATVTLKAPNGAALPFWEGVAGDTVTISLAAGETYMQRTRIPASAICSVDITGALLTSDRPVSVSTGGRGWAAASGLNSACSNNGGCGDEGEDHILPVDQLGTEYVISQYNTNGARRVMVVADEDNTTVTINGTLAATLVAGGVHEFQEGGVTRIVTNKPVYVYQNAALGGCEADLAFIPPLSFGSRVTNVSAVDVVGSGTARMLIEASQVGTIKVDNVTLAAPTLLTVPGRADLRVVSIALAAGTHTLEALGDFQVGVATSTSGTGLFAYYNIFKVPGCGDGVVAAAEGCDDGNTTSGDGCSSGCRIELGTGGCIQDASCVAGGFCNPMGVCVACLVGTNCDDGNGCTVDSCSAGACVNTAAMQGATCAGGVCNGDMAAPACVTCVDTEPLLGQDLGCPAGSPACDSSSGAPRCVGCLLNANCNDNNPCTVDACTLGACGATPVAAGTSCNAGAGVCNGSAGAPACVACVDDNAAGVDTGCTMAQPFCDRTGAQPVCVACVADTDCMAGQLCNGANACVSAAVSITAPANNAVLSGDAVTVSGAATAGEFVSVQLLDAMGAVVASASIRAVGGVWSFPVSGLAEGTYTAQATIAAAGGSIAATPVTFTLDDTAPTVALAAPADGAQTTDATPTISGSGEPGASVEVFVDNVSLGTVVIPAGGMWSLTPAAPLIDGAHSVRVVATDAAGNTAAAGPNAFGVDTTAPVVTITTPADGAVTANVRPGISGTSEPGSTVVVEVVDALGMVIFSASVTADAASGAWSAALTSDLADGAYTVRASGTDVVGNVGMQVSSGFVVDRSAPALEILTPADGAQLSSTQPAITGTTTPTTLVTVELRDATGALLETLTATSDAAGAWSVTPTMALADGTYTASAMVTSAAGVMASDATSFVIDTMAPMVTISTPADGAIQTDRQPTISGTSDPSTQVTVTILDAQGATVETLTVSSDMLGAWSVVPTMMLADGAYTVSAVATDSAGNTASAAPHAFTIDATGPVVVISSPSAGAVSADARPTITGTVEPGAIVVITIDGMVVGTVVADADGMWSLELTDALGEGAHTVSVVGTDPVGNEGQPVELGFTVDSMAPALTITSPTTGQQVGSPVTVTGTADPGAMVEIVIDGVVAGTVTAGPDGMWSFMTGDLGLGSHTVEATTIDGAGNMGSSGVVTFEVADMMMNAPVTITSPTTGGAVTGPSVTVGGTGEPGAMVTVTVGDRSQVVTVGADGTWSATFEDVPAGSATITATDGVTTVTIDVTVNDPAVVEGGVLLTGAGGCAQGAGGSPVSGGLWLLVMGAMALRRRRRAA
jgi:cysteine-rich repeat protein